MPVEPGAWLPYLDPAAYTARFAERQADIAYYLARCRRVNGQILECGCGNGRVTLPLARAGSKVTGVDFSQAMLKDLRRGLRLEGPRVRRRVALELSDMRQLRLKHHFAMVIAPFDTFAHLYNRTDVEAFLAGVRHHLEPRGQLVFDLSLPTASELMSPNLSYDAMSQVSRCRLDAHGARELSRRHYHPEELTVLLQNNGFSRVRLTADYSVRALHAGASTLVVSARPN